MFLLCEIFWNDLKLQEDSESKADFKKNTRRIKLYCGIEQTRIYQSSVCRDNEYHTCRLSLAAAAMRVILKIATCVLWNVGHKGDSVAACPGGEILHCVWGLKCMISAPTSLLKYFVWVILTFRAPNRCKIPALWKMDLIVLEETVNTAIFQNNRECEDTSKNTHQNLYLMLL